MYSWLFLGKLTSSTSSKGTFELRAKDSGGLEWLVTPDVNAAKQNVTAYTLGGKVKFSQGGKKRQVQLAPVKVSIKPDSSLHVHYFWEKKVQGTGETKETRAVNTFCFAVAVQNRGLSTGRGIRAVTPELEVMEEKTGGLAEFRVLGSMLGNEQGHNSLEVTKK